MSEHDEKDVSADRKAQLNDDVNSDRETGSLATDKEIARVYRKLDYRIIPALWILYFLCSAIRSTVGLAMTMNKETGDSLAQHIHLSGKQISTGLALFYVCYVVFDVPANLIMTRMPPQVWISRIVICVGIIGACHTAISAAWNFYLLRLLLGIVIAGMWPGMAYYLTLFYPPSRCAKRIGQYFTAAQVSAAVTGLVSAGFQKMNRLQGLTGYQWMFLLYGIVAVAVGIALLWWLPDRPQPPGQERTKSLLLGKFLPKNTPALAGNDAQIHYDDLTRVYHSKNWGWRDLQAVLLDWRLWPLTIMYFGVVGVGIGTQLYGTIIIQAINPKLTGVQLSLLFAPIWMMDLLAILLVTPISDRFHRKRPIFFSVPVCIIISGLLTVTYSHQPWTRYGGLLLVGFGLGPTVPICMTWTTELFQARHSELGVAAATALVSGLGNLGSVTTTYALYTGWASDYAAPGQLKFRKSNLAMIGILVLSILSSIVMWVLVRLIDDKREDGERLVNRDRAARREREERGLNGLFGMRWKK